MSAVFHAHFTKRFPNGPVVCAEALLLGGPDAAVTVLFGASGSGKTTVLRCLAGLERPDEGAIRFGDDVWFDAARRVFLPPRRRNIGFVPQDYALFPHLTVAGNINYGLDDLPRSERLNRCAETIRWLGLEQLESRLPRELSGGQQQRVALARAIVRRPRLLLLDEPLSALDVPARQRLRGELRHWLAELAIPTLLVTHDRTEALALGHQIVVLNQGRIEQAGPVSEVFNRPANLAVAQIAGVETVVPGRIVEVAEGMATVAVGGVKLLALAGELPPGTETVHVCIRAEDVILTKDSGTASSARNRIPARVESLHLEVPLARVELDCGFPLKALITRQSLEELGLQPGIRLTAWVKAPHVHLIAS